MYGGLEMEGILAAYACWALFHLGWLNRVNKPGVDDGRSFTEGGGGNS